MKQRNAQHTRDIFLLNALSIGDKSFAGLDMLSGEQISLTVENPAWVNRVGSHGALVIKADRCATVGDHKYSTQWVRAIKCDELTRVRKSEAATLDIYSLDGNPEHYHDPVSLKYAVDAGRRVNIIATLTSPSKMTKLSGTGGVTTFAQYTAANTPNPSYTPVVLLYNDETGKAYKYSCPYTPSRGQNGEAFVIKEAIFADDGLNTFLSEGNNGHIWAYSGVAINMSQTSIKTWLSGQILKATKNSSGTGSPYPMGSYIMETISNENYAPVAATIKRSRANPRCHYLAEITPIANKVMSTSLQKTIQRQLENRAL
jgi:hypothetical protein